jgi:hypothetical protein
VYQYSICVCASYINVTARLLSLFDNNNNNNNAHCIIIIIVIIITH